MGNTGEREVVLITGGSAGLGRALALAFADAGAALALAARDPHALKSVAREVRERGAACVAHSLDVRSEDQLRAWVADAQDRLGTPTMLINNASVLGARVPLAEYDGATWADTVDVNLTGVFLASLAVLPPMLDAGSGSIVNVSSGAAKLPRTGWGAYAVAKFGMEGLSANLAAELKGSGVRVNVVDPGAMRTAMRAAAYPDENPATVKPPAAVADLFLWLASEDARSVSGFRFQADEWLRRGTGEWIGEPLPVHAG